jgi:hypothetical protein
MATATITIKKGTTAEWTEAKRVLDDGELGLETTPSGHRIIRIGNGSTEFMQLPVAFDIEEVREIKEGMDEDAKAYAGKFRFYFTSYGGMCGYEFNQFFDEKDIDCENDMRVQEMFLEKINMLIDCGIIALEGKS